MKTMKVYKYHLGNREQQTVLMMPKNAEILSVGEQGGFICIWALVEPTLPDKERTFVMYGTGRLIEEINKLTFIGTGPDSFFCFACIRKDIKQ